MNAFFKHCHSSHTESVRTLMWFRLFIYHALNLRKTADSGRQITCPPL